MRPFLVKGMLLNQPSTGYRGGFAQIGESETTWGRWLSKVHRPFWYLEACRVLIGCIVACDCCKYPFSEKNNLYVPQCIYIIIFLLLWVWRATCLIRPLQGLADLV